MCSLIGTMLFLGIDCIDFGFGNITHLLNQFMQISLLAIASSL